MGLRSIMSLPGLCMACALELVWVLSMMRGAFAQNSNCNVTILTPLFPCVPYIEPGNTTTPASDCCDPLRSFLASADPTCICQIAPLAKQLSISVNETRALEVATSCNKQPLPSSITSCLSIGSAPTEAPSPTSTTSSTPPPQAGGNNSPSLGSALLPPPFLLISSIFLALSLHLGIMST